MNKTLTLEEFRATGKDADVGAYVNGYFDTSAEVDEGDHVAGRLYAGGLYIERNFSDETKPWCCTIHWDSRVGTLAEMEEFLYRDCYLPEVAGIGESHEHSRERPTDEPG